MRCFLYGIAGACLIAFLVVFVGAQYSDYQARAETGAWLTQIHTVQSVIEEVAIKQKSFLGSGKNIDKQKVTLENITVFEITDSGIIILRGGRDGQVITLIPSFVAEKIIWHCIGGSADAMPSKCKI
jgi:hypothetical protein